MEIREILERLPTRMNSGAALDIRHSYPEDFGPDFLLFKRESYAPDDGEGVQWDEDPLPRRWAAHCRCSACAHEWFSGWLDKHHAGPGIAMCQGPDGAVYDGVPGTESAEDWEFIECRPAYQSAVCPECGVNLIVTPWKELRFGRTYRLMAVTVERVADCAAIVFWMCARHVDSDGVEEYTTAPEYAVFPGEKFLNFARYTGQAWRTMGVTDPETLRYKSAEATCGQKVGSAVYKLCPNLGGTKWEKSALPEYVEQGGAHLIQYLRAWRDFPQVENLVTAGWGAAVAHALHIECERNLYLNPRNKTRRPCTEEIALIADWKKAAPRKMIHMNRDEVRKGAAWKWDADTLMTWMAYTTDTAEGGPLLGPGDAEFFNRAAAAYGVQNLREFANRDAHGIPPEITLRQVDRYLVRQCRTCNYSQKDAFSAWLDYGDMLHNLERDTDPETPEFFPNHLRRAHDALMRVVPSRTGAELNPAFARLAQKWAGLEYSDGEICIRIPRTNGELVREGAILHHCVGGYGRTHTAGKIVLFVRHARRPERPWYTLNEDLTGRDPKRVQLHGYKNEFHRGKRLHIPERVEKFVEAWEKDVLRPVFYAVTQTKGAGA